MVKSKNLREFLVLLNRLNRANIAFLDGKQPQILLGSKYDVELQRVQDLINSFEFIKEPDK